MNFHELNMNYCLHVEINDKLYDNYMRKATEIGFVI